MDLQLFSRQLLPWPIQQTCRRCQPEQKCENLQTKNVDLEHWFLNLAYIVVCRGILQLGGLVQSSSTKVEAPESFLLTERWVLKAQLGVGMCQVGHA